MPGSEGGWAFPKYSRRPAHFYPAGKDVSLCGRSTFSPRFREPETGQRTPDDCPACVEALRKIEEGKTDVHHQHP